jgi:glycerol-3-phosphate O-acyltransferase / dihydroxyacetone phosphate acyltransferase
MAESIRALTISDLILKRRGFVAFRLLLAAFGIALRLFFRRIETVDADRVPEKGGLIFVLNHPNGLIDPALVFVALPRRISFLAKSTLFRTPVISYILKTVEALPVYRKIDAGEDVSKNQQTFESARELLRKGSSIALFPEGISHNSPKLLPAKTGAARIALGAAAIGVNDEPVKPVIVPVGLFYTSKTTFRSEALLHFGEPFPVPAVELEPDGQPPRDAVKALTAKIEGSLREVTLNAESDAQLDTARIAEEIFAASAENENLSEKLEFLKSYVSRVGSRLSRTDRDLETKLLEYDRKLESRGIEPMHLSLSHFTRGFVIKQAIMQSWYLILLAPLAIVGTILHFPAYQLCKLLSFYFTHHGEDDIVSTVKVLAAMVFMPLTWLVTAAVVYYFFGWPTAIASIPVSILLGYIALFTLEEATELGGWAKAVWLYLTKRDAFLRLYAERKSLTKQLQAFDQN